MFSSINRRVSTFVYLNKKIPISNFYNLSKIKNKKTTYKNE